MSKVVPKKADAKKSRVFLVDDHPVTREGLMQLINFEADLVVCGQASGAGEALKEIPKATPDLVMVDISLVGGGNGLDLIKDLAVLQPGLPSIVLSSYDEKIYAERALRAGARGYVMKEEPIDRLLDSMRRVLRGEISVSDAMNRRLLGRFSSATRTPETAGVETLSDRELEVFRMLGQGRDTKFIAGHLGVSVSTVETYRQHIKEKLGLANATDLISAAGRWVQDKG